MTFIKLIYYISLIINGINKSSSCSVIYKFSYIYITAGTLQFCNIFRGTPLTDQIFDFPLKFTNSGSS